MNVNKYIKGYVNVNKDLHTSNEKSIDKKEEINYIKNNKKSNTKKEIPMTKNINTRLNELTDAVKMILNHIDVLEERISNDKKMVIKPLKGATKKVEKEIKTVDKKVAVKKEVKKATKKKDPKVVKLQKQALEMKSNMTKDQLSIYKKLWSKKWQYVNKTIDLNNKAERSMAFAKGRIECAKKAMTLDI